jgi:hypothetical protein
MKRRYKKYVMRSVAYYIKKEQISTNKNVGPFGFSGRNERGKMLITFCRQLDLVVITCDLRKGGKSCTHGRAQETGKTSNYILVKKCFRNSIKDMKTLPGVNMDSNLDSFCTEVQTCLKPIKKAGKMKPKYNVEKIKSKENVKEVTRKKLSHIEKLTSRVEDSWGKVKETL